MKKYYAVLAGREPGIYESWEDCKKQTDGFPKAEYKSFKTKKEANAYMRGEDPTAFLELREGLSAFVDGSFDAERGRYSFGIVFINNGQTETLNGVGDNEEAASMRNVAGELRGSMKAMQYAIEKGYDSINIYHDYEGIAAWAEGRWKTNLSCTAAYKEFCAKMFKKLKVNFIKVPAHSGVMYNEMADKLAKEALKEE